MPSIIISNNHLAQFGGSEMVTLELAEEFAIRGWKVDVYANHIAEPFRSEFSQLIQNHKFRLFEPSTFYNESNYDLAWIHHSVLPDSLIRGLSSTTPLPSIVWHHMSPFPGIESPILADIESKIANVSTFISEKTRSGLLEFGLPIERSMVFANPAPRAFCDDGSTQRTHDELKNLLLISNHPPAELTEALELLRQSGVRILHIGSERPGRVTAQSFHDVDAVVTIGKSVQYALCLGIPVFIYDHFGGEGWLTHENFQTESAFNFSGRSTERKLGPEEIAHEVSTGYKHARAFAMAEMSENRQRYNVASNIDNVFHRINITQDFRKPLDRGSMNRWLAYSKLQRENTIALRDSWDLNRELELISRSQASHIGALETNVKRLTEGADAIRSSLSFRVGNAIVRPLSSAKRILSKLTNGALNKSRSVS